MKINKLLTIFLCAISIDCYAIQEYQVSNNAEIDAIISDHDVNRISIAGARITQVKLTNKSIKIDTDEQNGQIFVYPTGVNNSKITTIEIGGLKANSVMGSMVSLFIMDDQGRSYNLRLRLQSVPSETILIKPLFNRSTNLNGSTDFTNQIVTMVEDMYLNSKDTDGYMISEENTHIKL